ncbi:hypothetical protein TMEN_4470 [Trichophyton mentagrophytes]|nr:hypothetical protein TMEN_4470 [Trichophyton mentagrophytes]
MSLENFNTSYRQYKCDTTTYLRWLSETAAKCGYKPQKNEAGSKYPFQTHEYLHFSTAIARSGVAVPGDILDTYHRIVNKRTEFYLRFSKQEGSSTKSNVKHLHIIKVVEGTMAILNWAARKSENSEPEESSLAGLAEWIAEQEPEEISDTNGLQTQGDIMPEAFCPEDDILAAFCLFEDLQETRINVHRIWSKYESECTSLMAAAVTTNAAFEQARKTCERFTATYPALSGTAVLPKLMYDFGCQLRGVDPALECHPDDPFNFAVSDIADWCFFPTTRILEEFSHVVEKGIVLVPKGEQNFETRNNMTDKERYYVDRSILMSLLPKFSLIEELDIDLAARDELTQGFRELIRSKNVPVWLAFQTQVLLDILNLLRSNSDRPFQELRLTTLRAKKNISQALQAMEGPSPFWPTCDEDLRHLATRIESVFDLGNLRTGAAGPEGNNTSFLKAQPITCGLMILAMNIWLQKMGIDFANASGSVMHLAHLYNVTQQESYGSVVWRDMDLIIGFHGEKPLFMGSRPTGLDESYKRLLLVYGVPAHELASKGRVNWEKSAKSRRKPWLLRPSPTVHAMMPSSIGPIDVSLKAISKLLGAKSRSLGTGAFLDTIYDYFADGDYKLLFNYFGMNNRCQELLRRLQDALHGKLVSYFGQGYIENDSQLSHIVLLILQVAAGSTRSARTILGNDSSGVEIASKLIVQTAGVMQEFLANSGGIGGHELRAFCKRK